MSCQSQIFKQKIPNELLVQLLESIAVKTDKSYIIDNNVYRKGVFNGLIGIFLEECTPYYHLSKRKYLEKKSTYNSFITIIRQICKFNNLTYTSQIKYDKSNYDIVYTIFFNGLI
jgi:hypothetical protein